MDDDFGLVKSGAHQQSSNNGSAHDVHKSGSQKSTTHPHEHNGKFGLNVKVHVFFLTNFI